MMEISQEIISKLDVKHDQRFGKYITNERGINIYFSNYIDVGFMIDK